MPWSALGIDAAKQSSTNDFDLLLYFCFLLICALLCYASFCCFRRDQKEEDTSKSKAKKSGSYF